MASRRKKRKCRILPHARVAVIDGPPIAVQPVPPAFVGLTVAKTMAQRSEPLERR